MRISIQSCKSIVRIKRFRNNIFLWWVIGKKSNRTEAIQRVVLPVNKEVFFPRVRRGKKKVAHPTSRWHRCTRWTKVKAGSINRGTCVDSGTRTIESSPSGSPFISAGERSIVPTCHASTAQEHLISFDPACPPRDDATFVGRAFACQWNSWSTDDSWVYFSIGLTDARWLTNRNTRAEI